MCTLLANWVFFHELSFVFSVHFSAELLLFFWLIDTPYIMFIFLLFFICSKYLLPVHHLSFIFIYGFTHQKIFLCIYIVKLVNVFFFLLVSSFLSYLRKSFLSKIIYILYMPLALSVAGLLNVMGFHLCD